MFGNSGHNTPAVKIPTKTMGYLYMYIHIIFLCLLWSEIGYGQTNLNTSRSLTDSDTLVSSNAIFKLGFFSPTNSTKRYVGVWYNVSESDGKLEVIWVANRNSPLSDSSGKFAISEDGNLQILNGENKSFWSSNVAPYEANNSVAVLQDSGNLVLISSDNGMMIWQSFDHPTDTLMPGMRFTIDKTVAKKQAVFWSWKSPSDPSRGKVTGGLTTNFPPQLIVSDGGRIYWRHEPWSGDLYLGLYSAEFTLVTVDLGKISFAFSGANQSALIHIVVTLDGDAVERKWDSGRRKWVNEWNARQTDCDFYGKCGPFGSCNAANSPICGCLTGFVPKNNTEWSKGNWTSGCVRRTSLQCGTVGAKADGFWNMSKVKVPDNAVLLDGNTDECLRQCLSNCSCVASSYDSSIGCMSWNGNLIDIQEFSYDWGLDFYVRLAHSELEQNHPDMVTRKSSRWKVIVIAVAFISAVIFGVAICLLRRQGMRLPLMEPRQRKNIIKDDNEEIEIGDLPMFQLKKLIIATNNFDSDNKLGRGGFGTVYKGKLEDGEDVAVKRLSKVSGQGLKEFMTEVLVISKLQHRNLVRLLGCCVEGEEKLLVYELMPNRSLDALLFDQRHGDLLDWNSRLNIIQGICRGLLYLHRDSRLRIIHRDLKASNILLDDKFNPKISDFGMARIFGGNEDQADTKRVVGTYGYMSPEYAMEGRFSEKSDVFSFGVLLLEIVSGRRISNFEDDESSSLVAHAWKLWNGDEITSFIDPSILNSTFEADEILRCIQVALLCVQELPEDRPNISMIIAMIVGEGRSSIPRPAQPGFTLRRHGEAFKDGILYGSVNYLSLSDITGR